jgi:pimeloyl-ACP methyl ester carboxylesterase
LWCETLPIRLRIHRWYSSTIGDVETGLFLGRIPYIKAGSGSRTAVIFFGANALFKRLDTSDASRYAAMFSRLLPADYSFYILGYEENPSETYRLDTIVDDLVRIVRTEIGRSTAIGVSFGAFVAIRFAAAQPELVDKLVILVGAHRFSAQGARKIAKQITYLKVRDFYGLVRENGVLFRRPWYNWLVRLKLWRDKDKLAAEFNYPTSIARAYESLFGADFERNREYADRVRAETLIIGGLPINTSTLAPSKKRLGGSPSLGWSCLMARGTCCRSRGDGMSPVSSLSF